MERDITQWRQQLDEARARAKEGWAAHQKLATSLDPTRAVVTEEEMRSLRQAGEWQQAATEAEYALFRAEHGTPGIVGSYGDYQWLSLPDFDITRLLQICPEVVPGKYLAVTSIDGGTLHLSEQEVQDGWWVSADNSVFRRAFLEDASGGFREEHYGHVAYSPRLTSIHGLPNETHDECCAGFDEWYVFTEVAPAGNMEAFVNWGGFRLDLADYAWLQDAFWKQMDVFRPESCIMVGSDFTFVTRNAELYARVLAALPA